MYLPRNPGATGVTLEKPVWVARWLSVFRDSANVRLACDAVGIKRQTAYHYRDADPEFAREWKEAEEDACDLLEAEARSRAASQSDVLLIFLLKAHRPDKFRDVSRIEHLIVKMNGEQLDQFIAERLAAVTAGREAGAGAAALPEAAGAGEE